MNETLFPIIYRKKNHIFGFKKTWIQSMVLFESFIEKRMKKRSLILFLKTKNKSIIYLKHPI
jgi:hypothetical protein